MRRYHALFLENEYLKVIVLPELGGHLYSCVDKATGAEMFYANRSIRKAKIGYRGAWAAFGVEFNFPVSHNWVSLSQVDSALLTHPDGSASIVVGNVDRPYGMEWRVELELRPGRARAGAGRDPLQPEPRATALLLVEQRGRARAGRHPHRLPHAIHRLPRLPRRGHLAGQRCRRGPEHRGQPPLRPGLPLCYGSRETFMGVWHPSSRSGVVHYSSPTDAPTKKIWSWGSDADGLDWRRALSDDESAYVEIQAGLFRNQETYAFLEPEESMRFREHWMPVRGIGGISRATPDGVLYLGRTAAGTGTRRT